jgi:cysteine desulfurase
MDLLTDNKIVYFDNNSTTPIDPRVLESMLPFLKNNFANPSSTHHFGINLNEAVKKARIQVADSIGAEKNEILFTSGATEAINIAIKGVAENYSVKGRHIITVSTEHYAVLDTCKYLETKGYEITYLAVSKEGLIDLTELRNSLRSDTILVCVMYVNNETGVIQPIKEIASIAHDAGALFMTDATQAAGKFDIDVYDLGIDLLCMSGHKMYAPKGIGALYVRKEIKLPTFIHGGGHERGVRSGTLNVPGIIALAKACEIAKIEMKQDAEKITALRNELENELLGIEGTFVNGNSENRIYNTTNICFPNVDASVLIGRMKNIAVSNGSACTSAIVEPSHVLTAMGLNEDDAFGSIRFSLGRYNTKDEVKSATKLIKELVANQY